MASVHDPIFALPPKPPFPFGTSPFRARGVLFNSDLARLRAAVPGGLEAVLNRPEDQVLRGFFQQRFSASGWYDYIALVYLGAATARARGIPVTQFAREAGGAHAKEAFIGFAGHVLRSVSYESIAVYAPRASAWLHDFGAIETKAIGPRHVRGIRRGMPQLCVHGWSIAAMQFTERSLEEAGAVAPRVHALAPEPDGEQSGYPLYRIPFEMTWS